MCPQFSRFGESPRRRSPRGLTLIEMLVVITLSGMVLGIVVSFTASLIQWDRRARNAGTTSEQLARLAGTLRNDIRRGAGVTLNDEDQKLTVAMTDGVRAVYSVDEDGCQRRMVEKDDKTSRTELFTFTGATKWQIDELSSDRRPLFAVALHLASRSDSTARLPPLLVQAALGADLPPTAIESVR